MNPSDGIILRDTVFAFVKVFSYLLAGEGVSGRDDVLSPLAQQPLRNVSSFTLFAKSCYGNRRALGGVRAFFRRLVHSLRGVLTARQYLADQEIWDLATKIYERVDDPDVQWRQDVLEWHALPNQAFFECHLGALLRIDAGIPRGDRFATHPLDASSRGRLHPPENHLSADRIHFPQRCASTKGLVNVDSK